MTNALGMIVAIFAHILNGSVSILDKFLLTKTFKEPAAYAFWIGLMGLATFFLLPFGFTLPHGTQWTIDLAAGATFVLALYFFYMAIQSEEVSRVIPIIGSMIPIVTLILSYIYLDERLAQGQIWSILVLIVGIILLTFRRSRKAINYKMILAAPMAAILFSLSSVLMKEVFIDQPFFGGLAWSRLGGFFIALIFLVWPENRSQIFKKEERPHGKRLWVFLSSRVFSASGFILVNFAISLSSPTIVNALQGVEYAFLFGLTFVLTKFHPQIIREQISRTSLYIKISGIIIIIIGTIILVR